MSSQMNPLDLFSLGKNRFAQKKAFQIPEEFETHGMVPPSPRPAARGDLSYQSNILQTCLFISRYKHL